MNKFYLIVPGALLLVFLALHQRDQITRQKVEAAAAANLAAKKAAEQKRLDDLKRAADENMRRHAEERARVERERLDKKCRDFEAAMEKLEAETAANVAEAEKLAREAAELADQLAVLRATEAKDGREAFDLAKVVEAARVQRRNADLDIQRAAELAIARVNDTSWLMNPATAAPRSLASSGALRP